MKFAASRLFKMASVSALAVVFGTVSAWAEQVKLNVGLSHPLLPAGKKQTTYLKVGLTGFPMKAGDSRAPVNVAIIFDKSGSMSGEKIKKAREAAVIAVQRLSARDIVSVVAYNNTVEILVPATKLTDKAAVIKKIRSLRSSGGTALFAGVSKGAAEVRKFLDRNHVNEVILLSDGLANVGPSTPGELGNLGGSLIKEGITVTTIGIGNNYNEDLMSRLAMRSDGNHFFARQAADLAGIFDTVFGDLQSVVAQEVVVTIVCADGIRPVRLLNMDGEINEQTALIAFKQLFSKQERYVLLEVEVPAGKIKEAMEIAKVTVTYANMQTRTTDELTSKLSANFSNDLAAMEKAMDTKVMANAVGQIAVMTNMAAVILRDAGKIDEARRVLVGNSLYIGDNNDILKDVTLDEMKLQNDEDADNLDGSSWGAQRKKMRSNQYKILQQRH